VGRSSPKTRGPHPIARRAGDKGERPLRLDDVEHGSGEPDERKRPDFTWNRRFVALVNLFEGEAEKQGQGEQQRQTLSQFDRLHAPLYHARPSPEPSINTIC
jgi:hypothetical protein